ncbi:S-methyl-5'-thioadenosine phosphorylase [Calderihabitans maritimus]|uniref:Probable 6-oxopurine nucleoside phosphorylase n=1 Tax=Calderihabitans maritimus TaxID=1246530 RepID=A0A1Z5HNF6_9FIRM|nr:S-methyl-5'-thioadenosine phosphorylase [Calderihabitans maritimus]GAW91044.1 hypothetical protein KKC1_02060 [Calderihabitans maritimus]
MEVEVGIIGGTGVYDPDMLTEIEEKEISTPYGQARVILGSYRGKRLAFLPRHGTGHSVPPHLVNYRANIRALKELGVRSILATAAVGSLNREMKPGQFVLVDQFLDFTKNRPSTFFEGGQAGVVHIDMTEPYCPELRKILKEAAKELGLPVHDRGTYVCTEGPRFETPAEIEMFRRLGGDLVGMTNVPEVVLAREAEICYATVATVTNFAAGISSQLLTHREVLEMMAQSNQNLRRLLMSAVDQILLGESRSCICGRAVSELGQL